jgi:anhydro-N-acetylmuramic acid kinase
MLDKLSTKKELRILGINSGTSADGIDLALIRLVKKGKTPKIEVLDGGVMPHPRRMKAALERAIQDRAIGLDELGRLDVACGFYFGKAADRFIRAGNHRVDLIGSHGQTIGHYPGKKKIAGESIGTTVQIGDGNAVATATGLPVVSDFRKADIAVGGEGAPLTPFVNQLLFGDRRKSRIIVNIGGIANFSYHPAGGSPDKIRGGDCGPGNIMSDWTCRLMFHTKYDRDGKYARKGKVYSELVTPVTQANRRRRVSAGREQYDQYLLARLVHKARRIRACKHDILASVDEAAAKLIHRAIAKSIKDKHLEGVYITGGGRRNLFMIERLRDLCKPAPVWPIETLGYDGDLLEAVSFAVLGGCYIIGLSSGLSQITGGTTGTIAGKLSLPPNQ